MRAFKTLIAWACLAAAMLVPLPGHAATHEVDVGNQYFNPAALQATAGDTIHWTISSGGHDVTSYGGGQSFGSPILFPGSDYSQPFDGGTVLYRCTPHSTIVPGGTCSGMCAAITDKTNAPATPDITTPLDGGEGYGNPVSVSGTGEAWTTVTLSEATTELARALVGGGGTWTVEVNGLSQGSHTLEARAIAVNGLASAGTDSTTFIVGVGPDTVAPTASVDTANLSVFAGAVTIRGTATDNRGVAGITVTFVPRISGAIKTYQATCVDCPLGTGGTVGWTLSVVLSPGIYDVFAVARDTANPPNTSAHSNQITILSLRVAG